MSRSHGWKPKPKFTAGLNVSQEEWDRIFGKKRLTVSDGDVNKIRVRKYESLTEEDGERKSPS
jgi:hypothetical protein